MSIFRPTPTGSQPVTTLILWQAYDVPYSDPARGTSRHFVGLALESGREGRASSPILEFDAALGQGKTASGRIYQLQGRPGMHPDADYVWQGWLKIHEAPSYVNVTDQVVTAMGGSHD